MSDSVLIERSADDELMRSTVVSDVPIDGELDDDVPKVGTILDDRYEILGLLGQGGMGHVLSARHVVLRQALAIKVLRREMTRDAEIVERFRREARAASAIGHAGIVAVRDFGSLPSGASYYVMEQVDGLSLADALAKERAFTIERAVDIVSQMADALGAAHAAGVVHRDVKPENVLLASFHGRPDHVKILDFGIAKLDFASRLSGAHRVLGTPAYMSPEQARGQQLDHRCDVYALGILFYELLAGDVPFDDRRPLEVLRQQIHTPAPSIRLLRPDVPEAIAGIIASCLEKSPDARPASMKVLAEQLAPFVTPRTLGFMPSLPPISTVSSVPRPPLPSIAVAPLQASTPPVAPSRPTPVAASPVVTKRSWMPVIAAGVALTVLGVIALAAAGGIVLRERSDETAPVIVAPIAIAAPIAPPATIVVPVVVAPPLPIGVMPSPIATAPVPVTPSHPLHPHPPAHVAGTVPVTEVEAPTAPPPSQADTHPTILVIDPWQ